MIEQPDTRKLPPNLELYTPAEAAAILGVSLRTLRSWIRSGALGHSRLGPGQRLIRISRRDLEAFLNEHRTRGAPGGDQPLDR